jgi:hypothetical protein
MGRCLSPCLGDLDPNAYRRRLDEARIVATWVAAHEPPALALHPRPPARELEAFVS